MKIYGRAHKIETSRILMLEAPKLKALWLRKAGLSGFPFFFKKIVKFPIYNWYLLDVLEEKIGFFLETRINFRQIERNYVEKYG